VQELVFVSESQDDFEQNPFLKRRKIMEKAYELQALLDGLKAKGLDVAEEAAKDVVLAVSDWLSASVKLSATPFDDIALVVLPKLVESALAEIDKIDGKIG
jgi:hypothetical protein